MAVTAFSQVVTTTRSAISIPVDDTFSGCAVWLYGEFHGSSNKIALGGSDVTLANGLHLYGGEKFGPIHIGNSEVLHVISDSAGGLDLRVFATGV